MEVLCGQLCTKLEQFYTQPASIHSLFIQLPILVQSPGMSQWLKIHLAEHFGIMANIEFPLPSSFIWRLYQQLIPDIPKQSAFTKDNMQWKLFQLLANYSDNAEFEQINEYLNSADQGNAPLLHKRFQLAGKIADIYDQYLVYRPDWLADWENQREASGCNIQQQPWQPQLWRDLLNQTALLNESPWHRANLHEALLSKLAEYQHPAPIFVFGISAIPKQQLDIFSALAQQNDVVIFWCNPCEHYWGDIVSEKVKGKLQLDMFEQQSEQSTESLAAENMLEWYETGNPLLASWGKLGREFQEMLLTVEEQVEFVQEDHFQQNTGSSLLEQIQNDILNLSSPALNSGSELSSYSALDDSIAVMSCHSKLRELEVLHDHILRQMQQQPSWSLGDIIVMMPNVADYAPYIDVVFGGSDTSRKLAYSISDRSIVDESTIITAFLKILSLHKSRFTVSEVFDLFSVPDILSQFAVSETDLELLQHWLNESGIRWGLDGKDKQRWQLPEEPQNTWKFGLSRLLSGYAMDFASEYRLQSNERIFPYAELEGQQAESLGKFCEFLTQLATCLSDMQQDVPLANKIQQAEYWLAVFFAESEEQSRYRLQIHESLAALTAHTHQYSEEIDQDVFLDALEQQLMSKGVGQRFLAGKVNFCTLMPMRSIPFQQVCILGLNDPGYPRVVPPIGFDLMASSQTRKGDRSRRHDDRYLFLEAILSARANLYLSYIGHSDIDNSQRAPSILLTEFLHYIAQQYIQQATNDEQSIVLSHALQPFNSRYFQVSNSRQQSFNPIWLDVLQSVNNPISTSNDSSNEEATTDNIKLKSSFTSESFIAAPLVNRSDNIDTHIAIADLINCVLNPARHFFRRRWNIQFTQPKAIGVNDEPLILDTLAQYQHSQAVLHSEHLTQADPQLPSVVMEHIQLAGQFPIGTMATEAINKVRELTARIQKALHELTHGDVQHSEQSHKPTSSWQDVALSLNNMQLSGRIHGVHKIAGQYQLVMWRPGKLRAKDRISLWLNWLLLNAAKTNECSFAMAHFVALDSHFSLPALEQTAAIDMLQEIVALFTETQNFAPVFFPETAWVWLTKNNQQLAIQQFNGNALNPALAEGNEAHFRRICPNLEERWAEFDETARRILGPLIAMTHTEKGGKSKTNEGQNKITDGQPKRSVH